ncbi:MAG: glucose 1-dehydrogenase [Pseudomonadota bacterium]|nr:glucose 1-dehydrogenase [Pseudomonadota bacterium]
MGRLTNKVAIITGGASGMGAATTKRFVEEGAHVIIADLQVDKGNELAESLGSNATFIATDVGREADVIAMIDVASSRYGRLDCLFNNAGFGGVSGEIHETDMGTAYERTVAGLLTGPILGMKHAAPIMREQQEGSIISTASVAGMRGSMGPHVYSALKAAVIGLTQSVAVELAKDFVRVNAICPGGIMTPIFLGDRSAKSGSNESLEEVLRPVFSGIQPIPRAGEPNDIADAALFLASDESSFITGHSLVVDGGLTIGRRRDTPASDSPLRRAINSMVGED